MKSASEWRQQLDLPNLRECVHLPWEKWIEEIQKDAGLHYFKAGERFAASLLKNNTRDNQCELLDAYNSILTDAATRTSLPEEKA